MADYVQTWRKKLRLKQLVKFVEKKIKSGKSREDLYKTLDAEMKIRWNLVMTTRKQYLSDMAKILAGQYVLDA